MHKPPDPAKPYGLLSDASRRYRTPKQKIGSTHLKSYGISEKIWKGLAAHLG
jgi:hypothetical protein